jgi:hypothetical protein
MYPHEVVGQAVESVHDLLKNRHDIDRKMTENFIDPRRVITMWAPAMGQWIRWTWGVCDCENVGRNEIPIINPDEALADILMLCAKDQAPGESLDPHEVEQLTGLIVRLNDWLARGGSLPQAWEIDVLLAEGSS